MIYIFLKIDQLRCCSLIALITVQFVLCRARQRVKLAVRHDIVDDAVKEHARDEGLCVVYLGIVLCKEIKRIRC